MSLRRFTSFGESPNDLVALIMYQMMGQVNKKRLARIPRRDTAEGGYLWPVDYYCCLRGETLTRKPYVRIPEQIDTRVHKKQRKWIICTSPIIVKICFLLSSLWSMNWMLFCPCLIPFYQLGHVIDSTKFFIEEI